MINNKQSLEGKVALVTGAGRGIGQAIAVAYGNAGAKIACVARTLEQIESTAARIKADGGEAVAITADVTDRQQVIRMYSEAERAFGGLDIVLINAGGNTERNRVEDSDVENWIATIELNLIGVYYCAREAIPYLKKKTSGKILTMGSGMGHRGMPGQSAYCVSKAGLWMLTQVLAQELVEYDISVNEIIPGPVNTSLTRSEQNTAPGSTPFSIKGEWIKEPQDVVDLALFLAAQPAVGPTAQSFSLMRRPG